jgi:hypothetical protein
MDALVLVLWTQDKRTAVKNMRPQSRGAMV